METQPDVPVSQSKKRPASGRLGSISPGKKRILDLGLVKLKSPAKRSMNELNKMALKLAYEKKMLGYDELDDQELTLADKIIQESKMELNMKPFGLEIDIVNESFKSGISMDTDSGSPSKDYPKQKKKLIVKLKDENHDDDLLNPTLDQPSTPTKNIPPARRTPTRSTQNRSPPKKRDSPFKSPKKTSPKKQTSSPLKNEVSYSIPTIDNRSMSLTDKLNLAASEESPMASPISTPRRHNRTKDMSQVFSQIDDIKPTNFESIPLMNVPDKNDDNDILLTTDKESKKKSVRIDGFEGYFEQIRLRSRPSLNSMSMAPPLTYEIYHKYNAILDNLCMKPIDSLNYLYERQSAQWLFEMQEGFNLAFYGVGSKRELINSFVQRILLPRVENTKCIVINGYNPEFQLKMLFKEIWQRCFRKTAPASRELLDLCKNTIQAFNNQGQIHNRDLILVIHNIDGSSLRNDKTHYILSELAKLDKVTLICTIDNVNTPLLWDTSAMTSFNFMWHNISTFSSYEKEVSFRDPLSLGKADEFVGSKGAKYVLISLNDNAKKMYYHLLVQQLLTIEAEIEEDSTIRGSVKGSLKTGIDYDEFYALCNGHFIFSSRITFRSILSEFSEHKMCRLTHSRSGKEMIFVPFTVDEIEKLITEELCDYS